MIARSITDIVIHCSATPNGRFVSIHEVDRWHRARGFARKMRYRERLNFAVECCGYHGLIYTTGFYCSARHFDEWGAHVKGSNARSIGLCMIGTDHFTAEQWTALKWRVVSTVRLLADQRGKVGQCETPQQAVAMAGDLGIRIQGHRDFSPDIDGDGVVEDWEWLKTCPGFDVGAWLRSGMVAPAGHIL